MKDTFIVFLFELKNRLKQKSIIVTTIIFMVIALLAPFIPRFMGDSNSGENNSDSSSKDEKITIGYITDSPTVNLNYVNNALQGYDAKEFNNLDELKNAVTNETIESGFLFKEDYSIEGFYRNQGLSMDEVTISISNNATNFIKGEKIKQLQVDPDAYKEIDSTNVMINPNTLGKNAQVGFLYAYVGMFVVYMTIILFGNQVATLVAREKSDRTMEILITTTNPTSLIVGKVFATAIVALSQMLLILLSFFIGYSINKDVYSDVLLNMIKAVSPISVLVFLIFYILGLLLYLFIFASLGALVSKVEEVTNAVVPISFIIVISFLVTSTTMSNPESNILRIASFIPFSSPISFFTRFNLIKVPFMDIIISISLLILTIIFFAILSIKIYRLGTLNYGNRIGLFKAFKMLKEDKE